jgi:hypothetical protein
MNNTIAPIFRTFTVAESSAIHNIEIDHNLVEIIFNSNSEVAYGFEASDEFLSTLIEIVESPDLLGESLGKVISNARKNGGLVSLPQADL